jgi:hypothetical protein
MRILEQRPCTPCVNWWMTFLVEKLHISSWNRQQLSAEQSWTPFKQKILLIRPSLPSWGGPVMADQGQFSTAFGLCVCVWALGPNQRPAYIYTIHTRIQTHSLGSIYLRGLFVYTYKHITNDVLLIMCLYLLVHIPTVRRIFFWESLTSYIQFFPYNSLSSLPPPIFCLHIQYTPVSQWPCTVRPDLFHKVQAFKPFINFVQPPLFFSKRMLLPLW